MLHWAGVNVGSWASTGAVYNTSLTVSLHQLEYFDNIVGWGVLRLQNGTVELGANYPYLVSAVLACASRHCIYRILVLFLPRRS